jgi:hypothetical protein
MRALPFRLFLLLLLIVSVARSGRAAGIYWANLNTESIGHANLDGSGADTAFITGASNPNYVAVDPAYIFWSNYFPDGSVSIGRANLDGSGANQHFMDFPLGDYLGGIATDGTYLYWTNQSTNRIGRASVDGSAANANFIVTYSGTLADPLGLALDPDHIYWTSCDFSQDCRDGDQVGRANLDGSGVNPTFLSGAPHTVGLAVDGSHIYWADEAGPHDQSEIRHAIGRANLDGTGVIASFIPATFPQGVAADGTYVYWSNFAGSIGRANLDGTGVNQNFIAGSSAIGVAVLVPEPSTGLLVIAGLLGLAVRRRAAD